MPRTPKRPCRYPGCPNLCDNGVYCSQHSQYSSDRMRGNAAERGYYSCQVIIEEQCTKDAKRKYGKILEELGYNVKVERHIETDDWGQSHYNISLKIRWD